MADLIPATGYVAVFTTIDTNGQTRYHSRPVICWTVGADGLAVGQWVNPANGRTAIAETALNFFQYMAQEDWHSFQHSTDQRRAATGQT